MSSFRPLRPAPPPPDAAPNQPPLPPSSPPPPPPPPPPVPAPVNPHLLPHPHHLGFAGGPAQPAPHHGFAVTFNTPAPPPQPQPPRPQHHLQHRYVPQLPQAPPPPPAFYSPLQPPSQRQPARYYAPSQYPPQYNPPPQPSMYYPSSQYPLQYNPPPQPPSQRQPSMYLPSSQYPPQYNPLAQPPPPVPPPSVPPLAPPPPPLVTRPSLPPPPPPSQTQPVPPGPSWHQGAKEAPQQKPPVVPPSQRVSAEHGGLSGPSELLETEDMRKRKRREREKQKQEATVLQKMQTLALGSARPHGKMMGEGWTFPFLGGERFNRLKKPTTFICKMMFRNELPDPTAQPKLLSNKKDKERYTRYSITYLEKTNKPKLFVEPDLGIPLDLFDMRVYNRPADCPPLAPEDEELLRDDEEGTPSKQKLIRKERPTDKGVPWLVKTQYISPLSADAAKLPPTEERAKETRESKEGQNIDLGNLNNKEKQLVAIEESFRAAKLPPIHQTNPDLEPVEILPIFPDFDRYKEQFVVVNFDGEPTADSQQYNELEKSIRDELEEQAIMKNFVVEGSDPAKPEKFFGYMVPAPDKLAKEKKTEKEDMSYSWVREYHWDVRGDNADNPTTYLLTFGDKDARYLPLPTKLVLQRKAKEGRSGNDIEHFPVPAKVTVKRKLAVAAGESKEPGETCGKNGHIKTLVSSSKELICGLRTKCNDRLW